LKAKPGQTATPAKTAAKPAAKVKPTLAKVGTHSSASTSPVKPAAKTAAKTIAKAPARVPAPPTAKPAAKASPPPASPKVKMPAASSTKPPAPAAKAKPTAPVETTKPVADAPATAPVPNGTLTQRPGRPSSRLASLTVPSMAQSVASTAAKASYMQLAAAPLIVPPLPSAAKKDPKLANNWKTKPADQLTDAELLAMPDSEYMNEKQLAAFRLKLSMLKRDILNSAGETTEHLREDTVVVPDPADRATIEEEHALELRTRDRERKLLKKIEQSISRIDAGDYGYCDETGESIGVGRLLARPTATLSLEAQQRRELKQKMFGD